MLSSLTRSLLRPLSPARVGISTEEEPAPPTSNNNHVNEPSIFYFDNPLSSFFRVETPITKQDSKEQQLATKTEQKQQPSNRESSLPSSSSSVGGQDAARQQTAHLQVGTEIEEQGVELIFPSLELGDETGDNAVEIQIMLTVRSEEHVLKDEEPSQSQSESEEEMTCEAMQQSLPSPTSSQSATSSRRSESRHPSPDESDNDEHSYYTTQKSTRSTASSSLQLLPTNASYSVSGASSACSSYSSQSDQSGFHALQAMIFQYENGLADEEEEGQAKMLANGEVVSEQEKTITDVKAEERQLPTGFVPPEQSDQGPPLTIAAAKSITQHDKEDKEDGVEDGDELPLNPSSSDASFRPEQDELFRLQSLIQQFEEAEHGSTGVLADILEEAPQASLSQHESDDEEYMALQAMIAKYETQQPNEDNESDDAEETSCADLVASTSQSSQEQQSVGQPENSPVDNDSPVKLMEDTSKERYERHLPSLPRENCSPEAISSHLHEMISGRGSLESEIVSSFSEDESWHSHSQVDEELLALQALIANYEEENDKREEGHEVTEIPTAAPCSCGDSSVCVEIQDEACTLATTFDPSIVEEAVLDSGESIVRVSSEDSCDRNTSDDEEKLVTLQEMIATYEASREPCREEQVDVQPICAVLSGDDNELPSDVSQTKEATVETQEHSSETKSEDIACQPRAQATGEETKILVSEHVQQVRSLGSVEAMQQAPESLEENITSTNIEPKDNSIEYRQERKDYGSKSPLHSEAELLAHSTVSFPDEISISTGDSRNDDKPQVNVFDMTAGEKNLLLIRELKHIQLHGPDMFDSIEDKIASWRNEEKERQSQLQRSWGSSHDTSSKSSKKKEVLDQGEDAMEKFARANRHVMKESCRPTLAKAKSQNLIRELEFVQTQGPDIFDAIDDKVKTWQKQESVRQLQNEGSLKADSVSQDEASHESKMTLQTLDENCKARQNTIRTSELTESTHSCSSHCSASLISTSNGVNTQEMTLCKKKPLHPSPGSQEIDPFEWDAPAHMSALVDEVLGAPAIVSSERSNSACDFDDTITVEVTVHSFVESVASDEEEWTIMDSLEDQPDVFEFFDFDNLDIGDDSEEYGVVGHGVSDNLSVISELTTPTVVSTPMKECLPAPTVALRSTSDQAKLMVDEQTKAKHSPRRLRKVQLSPRKAPRPRRMPFQQVKLRRAQSNPTCLPQMRQAALLILLRHQLKPVDTPDEHQLEDRHSASPLRSVRRCFSDKPAREGYSERNVEWDHTKMSSRPPENLADASNCILDFSWDELDELEETEKRDYEDILLSNDTGLASDEAISPAAPSSPPPPPSGAKKIGKTDSFYDSVSISFLASSIRDQTVVQVMDEALRILQTGGILNILDMNGSVIERIQHNSKYQALSFQKATATDQQRVETNTSTILKKCGLHTKFHVADPRIIHWTTVKPESLMIDGPPTSIQ